MRTQRMKPLAAFLAKLKMAEGAKKIVSQATKFRRLPNFEPGLFTDLWCLARRGWRIPEAPLNDVSKLSNGSLNEQ